MAESGCRKQIMQNDKKPEQENFNKPTLNCGQLIPEIVSLRRTRLLNLLRVNEPRRNS